MYKACDFPRHIIEYYRTRDCYSLRYRFELCVFYSHFRVDQWRVVFRRVKTCSPAAAVRIPRDADFKLLSRVRVRTLVGYH